MDFDFRRIDGGDWIKRLTPAPNKIVDAVLSCEKNGNVYAVMRGGAEIGTVRENGGYLDCFCIAPDCYMHAQNALACAVDRLNLSGAKVLTADSKLLSLCLSLPHTAAVEKLCYMFCTECEREYLPMRHAALSDLPALSAMGFVSEHRLERLINEHGVYVLNGIGGIGGFGITEQGGADAAVISAFVDNRCRGVGIGSYIFYRLGSMCRDYGIEPIALCGANDTACKKALENAGFACFEKTLLFNFS